VGRGAHKDLRRKPGVCESFKTFGTLNETDKGKENPENRGKVRGGGNREQSGGQGAKKTKKKNETDNP